MSRGGERPKRDVGKAASLLFRWSSEETAIFSGLQAGRFRERFPLFSSSLSHLSRFCPPPAFSGCLQILFIHFLNSFIL